MKASVLALTVVVGVTCTAQGETQPCEFAPLTIRVDSTLIKQAPSNWMTQQPVGYRSKRTAWLLALGTTIVPVLVANHSESEAAGWLGAAGILVGPSTGSLYARDRGRGYGGIGLRVLGTVLVGAAMASYETGSYCLFFCDRNGGLALAGLGLLVGSTVWNFATISSSVERHNERVRDGVKIAPAVDPQNGGSGLRLSVRF